MLNTYSLVNFQTEYKMTSKLSWLDARTRIIQLSATPGLNIPPLYIRLKCWILSRKYQSLNCTNTILATITRRVSPVKNRIIEKIRFTKTFEGIAHDAKYILRKRSSLPEVRVTRDPSTCCCSGWDGTVCCTPSERSGPSLFGCRSVLIFSVPLIWGIPSDWNKEHKNVLKLRKQQCLLKLIFLVRLSGSYFLTNRDWGIRNGIQRGFKNWTSPVFERRWWAVCHCSGSLFEPTCK